MRKGAACYGRGMLVNDTQPALDLEKNCASHAAPHAAPPWKRHHNPSRDRNSDQKPMHGRSTGQRPKSTLCIAGCVARSRARGTRAGAASHIASASGGHKQQIRSSARLAGCTTEGRRGAGGATLRLASPRLAPCTQGLRLRPPVRVSSAAPAGAPWAFACGLRLHAGGCALTPHPSLRRRLSLYISISLKPLPPARMHLHDSSRELTLRVQMRSFLVGRRTGPRTCRSFSRAPRLRSAQTFSRARTLREVSVMRMRLMEPSSSGAGAAPGFTKSAMVRGGGEFLQAEVLSCER
mmetsp:Transcript_971/g.2675  ORF Transcript_971/g.2675 Transcript_971/m.2675 type:complete len:294 (+) Transcript_971:216-1097(+)